MAIPVTVMDMVSDALWEMIIMIILVNVEINLLINRLR